MTTRPSLSPPGLSLPASLDDQASLRAYERALQRELSQLTDRAIDQWLKDSDAAFRNALKDTVEVLSDQLADELSQVVRGGGAAGASGGDSSARLANAIGSLVSAAVRSALGGGEQTRITQRETARSQDANRAFRRSRAQIQADALRDAQRGQRNL